MKTSRVAAAFVLAGALFAAGCGGGDGGAAAGGDGGKPVKVAAVLTLTGLGADFGAAQKAALELGFEDAEAQDGVALDVQYADSGDSNTVALSALQSVLRDEPAVVFGPYLGSQIMAMRPRLESAKVPMIAMSGTPSITKDKNTSVYRWATSVDVSEPATAEWAAKNLGIKRPAILADTSAFGQQGTALVEQALSRAGLSVVAKESMNPADTDIAGQLFKIGQAQPDAVFVQVIGGATGAVVLKGLESHGMKVPVVWGSGIVYHSLLDLATPAQVEGVYGNTIGSMAVAANSPDAGIADVLRRYKDKTGRAGDTSVIGAYDGARAIASAIKAGKRTPAEVADWLRTTSYKGLLGTYKADADGNMLQATTVVQIKDKEPVAVTTLGGATG